MFRMEVISKPFETSANVYIIPFSFQKITILLKKVKKSIFFVKKVSAICIFICTIKKKAVPLRSFYKVKHAN